MTTARDSVKLLIRDDLRRVLQQKSNFSSVVLHYTDFQRFTINDFPYCWIQPGPDRYIPTEMHGDEMVVNTIYNFVLGVLGTTGDPWAEIEKAEQMLDNAIMQDPYRNSLAILTLPDSSDAPIFVNDQTIGVKTVRYNIQHFYQLKER